MKKKQGKKNGNLEDGIRRIVNFHRQNISDIIFNKLTLCIVESQNITPNEFARRWLIENSTVRTDNLLAGFVDEHYAPYVELKSFNFDYQVINTKLLESSNWSYKILKKFVTSALQKDIDIIHLLAQMQAIITGLFSQADSSMVTSVINFEHLGPLQAFFYTKTDKNITLFWEVGIDKIPKIARVAKEYQKDLLGYDYIHTITFIDCRYCLVESPFQDIKNLEYIRYFTYFYVSK